MDNQGTESVPSLLAAKDVKDEENKLLAPNAQDPSIRDDNQNNVNNRIMSIQNLENLNIGERVRGNLKQLLALYAKLTRQLMEFIEAKAAEQSSYKAKNDEMSSQVSTTKRFKVYAILYFCNILADVIQIGPRFASNAR